MTSAEELETQTRTVDCLQVRKTFSQLLQAHSRWNLLIKCNVPKEEKEPPKKAEKKEKDKGKAATSEGEKGPNGELMFQVGRQGHPPVSCT